MTETAVPADYGNRVYARGFLLTPEAQGVTDRLLAQGAFGANLSDWTRTWFGQYRLWYDRRLAYGSKSDPRFAVGVLGLCIDPFHGITRNDEIASVLHEALCTSTDRFLDLVDCLSGAFVILFRDAARVRVLQDAAATKPVYFHRTESGLTSVSSHASLLAGMFGLRPDARAKYVWSNEVYRADPSRYLPGLITPVEGVRTLTGNHFLDASTGRTVRFFPRRPNFERPLDEAIVDRTTRLLQRQAELIGGLGRPLWLAATGGRDSRVTAATFLGQPRLRWFSFHMPSINHLTKDVEIAGTLARLAGVPLSVFRLEDYRDPAFTAPFNAHSPMGIWPAAALCYIREFEPDAIHIRSTVSEIGRIFYGHRPADRESPEALARAYTQTPFADDPLVRDALREFIQETDFAVASFFNYDLYDMFYWEHRNAKWQNVLCAEAERATDVFIPYNNRRLLTDMMSLPVLVRRKAELHRAVWRRAAPPFDDVDLH